MNPKIYLQQVHEATMSTTTRKGALVCTAAKQRVEQAQHRQAAPQNA